MTSPISIRPNSARWRAQFAGHVIADSGEAVVLDETGHEPVVYFPRDDVAMEYMARTDRRTYCPWKGDAAYYTLMMDGRFAENGVWSYEDPLPDAELIRGRLAFRHPDIELYEVAEQAVNPAAAPVDVDEVVRHTDAGDGHSQAERWTPPPEERPARW